jgi:MFS family permease
MFGSLYKNVRTFVGHHWLTVAFLLGFILDNLTLTRVDQVFDNVVLLGYVILAMLSILMLYAGIAERFGERVSHFLKSKSPFLMQYAFGGLLSGMLIFYGRSGSLSASWPFLLIILGVIYGNETIKNRSQRLVYNLVIFFVGLFAYVTLIVPVYLGKMGPVIFVGSGLLALLIMYVFFGLVTRIVPNFVLLQKRNVVFIIGCIYLTLNVLYFTNLIPPIPLSLKEVGIYHSVVKYEDGSYELTYEKPKWWEWYRDSDKVFHYSVGENIFCFASVFSPSRLNTSIYHKWEYFDEEAREWKVHGRYAYPILGGRDDGYRGYTQVTAYHEGEWRCTVETERGQVIGRESFTIASGVRGAFMTERK